MTSYLDHLLGSYGSLVAIGRRNFDDSHRSNIFMTGRMKSITKPNTLIQIIPYVTWTNLENTNYWIRLENWSFTLKITSDKDEEILSHTSLL